MANFVSIKKDGIEMKNRNQISGKEAALTRLTISLAVVLNFSNTSFAEWVNQGDFTYYADQSTGTAWLDKYKGTDSEVTIPRTIQAIEQYWENGELKTRTHTLPVTSIGEVTIYAYGNHPFENNTSIRRVIVPDTVKHIRKSAFKGCSNLECIARPGFSAENSSFDLSFIETIESEAFSGCRSLSGALLLDSAKTIGESAFRDCIGITSVKTGKNLQSLDANAFIWTGCTVAEIDGNGSLSLYDDFYCSSFLEKCIVGDGVASLYGNGASSTFTGCRNLKEVQLGTGIRSLPNNLFSANGGGGSLTKVTFTSVTNIGTHVFYGCKKLSEISSLDDVLAIGAVAFSSCCSLTNNISLASVRAIGNAAFHQCSQIGRFKFGEHLTSIGEYTFQHCTNACLFEFSGPPPTVGNSAFQNVKSGAIGTYTAAHAAAWDAVIDSQGYWNGLKMKEVDPPPLRLAVESAEWSNGSIKLCCTEEDTSGREHTYTLQFYDKGMNEWKDVSSVKSVSTNVCLEDMAFASRLGGIPPVKYRVKDENGRESKPCETRNRYLLAVGYNDFLVQKDPKPGHYNDASQFRSLCVSRGEFKSDNAHFIANQDATTAKVRNEMYNFAAIVQPGDIFVFYISTHGGDYGGTNQAALATYDSVYRAEDLLTDVRHFPTGTAVINVIMACHSFALTGGVHVLSEVNEWLAECGFGQCLGNVAWITSCDAQQKSYTYKDEENSKFGKSFIVNGFDLGCADGKLYGMDYGGGEPDWNITFGELYRYARAFFTGLSDDLPSTVQCENENLLDRIVLGRRIASSSWNRPDRPMNVVASQGQFDMKVQVDWDTVANAHDYRIYRYDEGIGPLNMKWVGCTRGRETSFVDTSTTNSLKCILGKRYGYCVKAVNPVGMSEFSTEGIGWRGTLQYLLFIARTMGTETASAEAYDAREMSMAPNGVSFGDSWVAGLDPTNENSRFIVDVTMTNDRPYVTWTPNLNTNGFVRNYTIWGKTNLTDEIWHTPTNSASHFFKVTVEMP